MTQIGKKMVAAVGFAALVATGTASADDAARSDTPRSSDGSVQGSATMPSTAPGQASSPATASAPSADRSAQPSGRENATASKKIEGRVERLERDNTLVIAGTEKVGLAFQPLKIEPSTEVMVNGRKASPNDIQEGDEVRASLAGSGDDVRVERIDIVPSTPSSGISTPSSDSNPSSSGMDDGASRSSGTSEPSSGTRDDRR